jgi:hypothetical protein
MTKVTPLFALWLGATLSGCVPNGYEASTVVLLVTPLAVAVGYALVAGLVRLARREVPITLAAPAALAGTSLVLGLASLYFASGEVDVGEWFLPGVAFFGASFLTVFLVAFRVGQRVAPLRSTRTRPSRWPVPLLGWRSGAHARGSSPRRSCRRPRCPRAAPRTSRSR